MRKFAVPADAGWTHDLAFKRVILPMKILAIDLLATVDVFTSAALLHRTNKKRRELKSQKTLNIS